MQFFVNTNLGLSLDNQWGDLIRLLDKCLVNGVDLPNVKSAEVVDGNIKLSFVAEHQVMLFQVVRLSGFLPEVVDCRVIGVLSATELLLQASVSSVNRSGSAMLAPLGYEIVFRDVNDVKRVYRAKNATNMHPYIRVDESVSSDEGSYTATWAKYAMVGLLGKCEHIDDVEHDNQIPFDSSNPLRNWSIKGSGTSVVRGWARWYWSQYNSQDNSVPPSGKRTFSLFGDMNHFFLKNNKQVNNEKNFSINVQGCGVLTDKVLENDKAWFLCATKSNDVSTNFYSTKYTGNGAVFRAMFGESSSSLENCVIFMSGVNGGEVKAYPVAVDTKSGYSAKMSSNNVSALTFPLVDEQKFLRGVLPILCYSGNRIVERKPLLMGKSMYVQDNVQPNSSESEHGGFYAYLGELS